MENNLCKSFAAKALTFKKVSFDKGCKTIEDQVKMARFKLKFRSVTRNVMTDFDKETDGDKETAVDKNERKMGSTKIGVITRRTSKTGCYEDWSHYEKWSCLF